MAMTVQLSAPQTSPLRGTLCTFFCVSSGWDIYPRWPFYFFTFEAVILFDSYAVAAVD